jgi:transposase
MRGFWPRFRDLKERVRTAPAIRLEAKLDLERRLRSLGSRAYKAQEVVYAHSSERKLSSSTQLKRCVSQLKA